jgi:HNH endonuclease
MMRDEVKALRSNYQTARKNRKLVPLDTCERCGMHVSEHRHKWEKSSLQLHHKMPISECVDRGILDPKFVNSPKNVITLCYFCHREWHTFAEPLQMPFDAWMGREPVFDQFGREPLGESLDTPADKFRRKVQR